MKDKYITGLLNKYAGKRDIAIADLSVYLDNPVGVGEHGDIGEVIEKKLIEIDDCNSVIDTITRYFSSNDEGNQQTEEQQ